MKEFFLKDFFYDNYTTDSRELWVDGIRKLSIAKRFLEKPNDHDFYHNDHDYIDFNDIIASEWKPGKLIPIMKAKK